MVSEGENHRVASLGNLLLCLYWGEPPLEALEARIPWVEETIAGGSPLGLFVLVTKDAAGTLPGRSFRQESKRQAAKYRGSILFSASVIEGDSVTTVLVRSFLRGLATVVARGIPVRFFDSAGPAAAWAARELSRHDGPSTDVILAAVKRLRAEHGSTPDLDA